MNLLTDILTYIRRIIKSPSNAQITDSLLIDYVNRFWLMDVDARVQLFDLKTKYQFQTTPGIVDYNMPLYNAQPQNPLGNPPGDIISPFPVYQGFMMPCYANGIQIPFYTQRDGFYKIWPQYVQSLPEAAVGNGGSNYNIPLPYFPTYAGHVDMAGVIASGSNVDPPVGTTINTAIPSTSIYSRVYFTATDGTGANAVVADSGQFLVGDVDYGLLLRPGSAPYGNLPLSGGYTTTLNTVNYQTGMANVTFTDSAGAPLVIPAGNPIQAQCYYFQPGIPRAVMFFNNIIEIMPTPDTQYLIELDAYLTPAAFLNSGSAVPFGYMAEYIARGAARKILADTGDIEQFQFYEPLFREQEMLVWKRSQRIVTSTRTGTI